MKRIAYLAVIFVAGFLTFVTACGDSGDSPAGNPDADAVVSARPDTSHLGNEAVDPDDPSDRPKASVGPKALEGNVSLWGLVTESGVEYAIGFFGNSLEGVLSEGDSVGFEVPGLLSVNIELRLIYRYGAVLLFTLDGLVNEMGEIDVPFGDYYIYWGTDPEEIPEPSEDLIQGWFRFGRDAVTYHGHCFSPHYYFVEDGVVDEEGGTAYGKVPDLFRLYLQIWGMGEESKTVDVLAIDNWDDERVYFEDTLALPNSILLMRVNRDEDWQE